MFDSINTLGEKIRKCKNDCEGIYKSPSNGIIPRGLWYEDKGIEKTGCAIVGINPGKARPIEKQNYNEKTTYREMFDLWGKK